MRSFVDVSRLNGVMGHYAIAEFVEHYHRERNHQGLGNELIDALSPTKNATGILRRQRLGGLLNYYCRAA